MKTFQVNSAVAPWTLLPPATNVRSPLVFVSILHWDSSATTVRCIESVLADEYPHLAIVLVDNGSNGVTCGEIIRRWPDITLIRNAGNMGFAEGQNQGIEFALAKGADFVLMLNDDAIVLPGCIHRMVACAMSDRRIGLVSPVIRSEGDPDRVQFEGAWVDPNRAWVMRPSDASMARAANNDGEKLFCLWGTALMIRRELIEHVGLLDQSFFAYYEDLDYSVRAHSAGWFNRMCFDATVLHKDKKNLTDRPPYYFYFSARNELLWWRKHFGVASYFRIHRVCLALFLRRTAVLQEAGLASRVDASMAGLRDGYTGRSGPYREDRRMPRWISRLLLSHPYFLANVLEGRLWSTSRKATPMQVKA